MFWKRSVQLAMTGFGNVVAPCIARKSRKTTSKNPTYADRGFCGGEAGICISAECKNNVLETERAAGDDRVRQQRCPVRSTEIPQNDIKKPDLFRSGFFVAQKQGFVFQRSVKTMFWKRSVQLAVTGFGNVVAPCIARKSLKTTSKNPTYSDRGFLWRRSRDLCFSGV